MSELLRATIALQEDSINMLESEVSRLTAECERLRGALEIAYSEMAFTVHDLAGRRLDSEEAIDSRSSKLSKCADELRAVLDRRNQ